MSETPGLVEGWVSFLSGTKNPVFVEGGGKGARIRWGDEPRSIRLDALEPPYRRLIIALIEAAKSASEPVDAGQS